MKPNQWQRLLPLLNRKRLNSSNPRIHAHYANQESDTHFYVAEGKSLGGELYLYWGFAVIPGQSYPIHFEVSTYDLETGEWLGRVPCTLVEDFVPGNWNDFKNFHFTQATPRQSGRERNRSTVQ